MQQSVALLVTLCHADEMPAGAVPLLDGPLGIGRSVLSVAQQTIAENGRCSTFTYLRLVHRAEGRGYLR